MTWSAIQTGLVKWALVATLAGFLSSATSNEPAYSNDKLDSYLQSLPGFWKGVAIETPVGSMSYDIFFHTCNDGTIAGVAQTGASLHYWQFIPHQNKPHLKFLSTFRGNRTPVLLLPRASDGSTLKFYAPELALLTLEVTFSKSTVDIRVFHHDKPHVHIRLTQTRKGPVEPALHHTLSNSCRGYPAFVSK